MEKIGKYHLIRKLGEGGMAEVFLVKDEYTERIFAMKILYPHLASQEFIRQRFIQEAKTTILLQHANIVKCLDINQASGRLYILMEYIEGRSLEEFCAINRLLPMHRVIGIIFKCCLADIQSTFDISIHIAVGCHIRIGDSDQCCQMKNDIDVFRNVLAVMRVAHITAENFNFIFAFDIFQPAPIVKRVVLR